MKEDTREENSAEAPPRRLRLALRGVLDDPLPRGVGEAASLRGESRGEFLRGISVAECTPRAAARARAGFAATLRSAPLALRPA